MKEDIKKRNHVGHDKMTDTTDSMTDTHKLSGNDNIQQSKTLLEIIDTTDEPNILQTMDFGER